MTTEEARKWCSAFNLEMVAYKGIDENGCHHAIVNEQKPNGPDPAYYARKRSHVQSLGSVNVNKNKET